MSLGDWFDRAKVVTSLYREADRLYYDAVAEEMQRGIRDDGLWLMAFEKAEGNEARTKAFYIGLRVQRLKEQATIMGAAEREKEPPDSRVTPPAEPYSPDRRQTPAESRIATQVTFVVLFIFILSIFLFAATL